MDATLGSAKDSDSQEEAGEKEVQRNLTLSQR
jgi:hypothetical protein